MPVLVDEFQAEAEARHRRRITRPVAPRLSFTPGHVSDSLHPTVPAFLQLICAPNRFHRRDERLAASDTAGSTSDSAAGQTPPPGPAWFKPRPSPETPASRIPALPSSKSPPTHLPTQTPTCRAGAPSPYSPPKARSDYITPEQPELAQPMTYARGSLHHVSQVHLPRPSTLCSNGAPAHHSLTIPWYCPTTPPVLDGSLWP